MKSSYRVAVVGIGGVGSEMIRVLKQRNFPCESLEVFARSARPEVVDGVTYQVQQITEEALDHIDVALFAGGEKAEDHFGLRAINRRKQVSGLSDLVVIDNGNAFRMYPNVPLVVPEVNSEALRTHQGIIANPNCSTIQMVVALKPLHDVARIKRIVVSTYQAASGKSAQARAELMKQTKDVAEGRAPQVDTSIFPYQIYGNCLPHIDVFLPDGYTKEELKMMQETRKILGDDSIQITATTVRVPVDNAHAESVNIEFHEPMSVEKAREILANAPGIVLVDDPANNRYPLQSEATGTDPVYVGRLRQDRSVAYGINLWVVADNIRKGAALNAVQIAEKLREMGLL
ncbi:MAG TPA: aspartate-semialdehyde dehydrogenase [Armatimonadota bacterium]|nr:aspartate-semialdehyde dehydrogenase [Armatimonadota bacterium]